MGQWMNCCWSGSQVQVSVQGKHHDRSFLPRISTLSFLNIYSEQEGALQALPCQKDKSKARPDTSGHQRRASPDSYYKIPNLLSVRDVKPSIMFQLHIMVRINPVLAWLLSTRRVVKSVPIRGQGN